MRQLPVFDVRPLPEFGIDVVEHRLRLVASRAQRSFSTSEFGKHGISRASGCRRECRRSSIDSSRG